MQKECGIAELQTGPTTDGESGGYGFQCSFAEGGEDRICLTNSHEVAASYATSDMRAPPPHARVGQVHSLSNLADAIREMTRDKIEMRRFHEEGSSLSSEPTFTTCHRGIHVVQTMHGGDGDQLLVEKETYNQYFHHRMELRKGNMMHN
jgi:hypothetical protein